MLVSISLMAAACSGSSGEESLGSTDSQPEFGSEEFGLTFEELTERVEQVEQSIGVCMAAAGFEYVPLDFATVRAAMTSDKSAPGLSEEEFTEEFGLGISTQAEKPIVELGRGEDNQRVLADLSSADRDAYLRTLYGINDEATFAYGLEDEDFSRIGGCTQEAVGQFFTPEELQATYFNPGDALIEQDSRVQAALEGFADCMAEAGFDYSHPDQVEDDLWDQLESILAGRDRDELTGADLEALRTLQQHELAVAPVSIECEEDELEPVVDSVEAEIYGANPG